MYCKKTLKHYGTTFFIKNKIYHITQTQYGNIYISDEISRSSCFHILETNEDKYKLEYYFYSEKELRKRKLKNIYENRQ